MPVAPLVDPGSLRHRITIQSQSATPDAFGQPVATWTAVAAAWASISVLSEREQYANGQLSSQATHVILLRYQPVPLAPGMRVVCGAHTYQLQALNNLDQRNVWLKLLVLELQETE